MHFGRIFINLTYEEDGGFRIASSNVTAVEFEDKSLRTKGLPLHPNLMIAETETEKRIALQLLGKVKALNQDCFKTQISTLFICIGFLDTSSLERDHEILGTLLHRAPFFFKSGLLILLPRYS